MRFRITALFSLLALAGSVAGCGGDDSVGDVVPRSTPELTAPQDADLGSNAGSSTTTDTTTTDTTATTPGATTPAPSAPATPAPSAPQTGGAAPQTPGTGGGGTGGGTAPETGGASPGAFSEFCRQNPGACPDQ